MASRENCIAGLHEEKPMVVPRPDYFHVRGLSFYKYGSRICVRFDTGLIDEVVWIDEEDLLEILIQALLTGSAPSHE